LGRREILNLKSAFASKLGEKRFHSALLEGGEIPFHLIGEQLKKAH
jgi:uncharacterized protein (DUF885 family)